MLRFPDVARDGLLEHVVGKHYPASKSAQLSPFAPAAERRTGISQHIILLPLLVGLLQARDELGILVLQLGRVGPLDLLDFFAEADDRARGRVEHWAGEVDREGLDADVVWARVEGR